MKFLVLILIFVACGRADDNSTAPNRQKKAMLFFDDDGNLMKIANPYLKQLAFYAARRPEQENFLKYFFNFLRPLIINTSTAAYMIPVSEEVVQQINRDPVYQNKLTITKRGPEFNPLCAGRRTQIASPSACNSFLSCWDGWAYELECPEGLLFSNEGYCDYADSVQCRDRVSVVPDPQTPRCKNDFETFRNEHNCNEFFVCVNRKPVMFKCPADLVYSPQFGVCDYPNLVDCSSSQASPPAPPTSAASTPAPAPPSPATNPPALASPATNPPAPSPLPPVMNKPSLVQNPPNIINLPSTFPSIISSEINKNPAFIISDHRTQQNIVPGIPQGTIDENKAPEFQFKPNVADGNAIFMQNSVYNNQNWATPVAIMSPEDAVKFLKYNNFAANIPPSRK